MKIPVHRFRINRNRQTYTCSTTTLMHLYFFHTLRQLHCTHNLTSSCASKQSAHGAPWWSHHIRLRSTQHNKYFKRRSRCVSRFVHDDDDNDAVFFVGHTTTAHVASSSLLWRRRSLLVAVNARVKQTRSVARLVSPSRFALSLSSLRASLRLFAYLPRRSLCGESAVRNRLFTWVT